MCAVPSGDKTCCWETSASPPSSLPGLAVSFLAYLLLLLARPGKWPVI